MRYIQTVLGPVKPQELGFCQSHEHLAIAKGASFEANSALWMDDPAKSTKECIQLRKCGGGTLIDAQPVGCGRIISLLREASAKSGIHILASTGFHKMCFYPEDHWIRSIEEEELAQLYAYELTVGCFDSADQERPVFPAQTKQPSLESLVRDSSSRSSPRETLSRAAQIKTALDKEGLTPLYKKLFAAAAKAAVSCDVPLMVHIEQHSQPLALLAYLQQLHVSPHRIIFCHMDRSIEDLAVHKEVLRQGVTLEYDTIGRFRYHSDEREIQIFREMLDSGYEDQLLFSLDTTRKRLRAYDPTAIGLDYLLREFVPLMKRSGISDKQIRKISHDNLVRVFTQNPVE